MAYGPQLFALLSSKLQLRKFLLLDILIPFCLFEMIFVAVGMRVDEAPPRRDPDVGFDSEFVD